MKIKVNEAKLVECANCEKKVFGITVDNLTEGKITLVLNGRFVCPFCEKTLIFQIEPNKIAKDNS